MGASLSPNAILTKGSVRAVHECLGSILGHASLPSPKNLCRNAWIRSVVQDVVWFILRSPTARPGQCVLGRQRRCLPGK
ncbi:hypothetical protein J2Z21_008402 [Streptomyces griseochromogenes]|uniref:Transposase n=1 Tax=Streptomyces griseochromogenes TaxID=68214 RepID=A0ABS4M6V7_9ACTN|nr:hypothetical protein [Streptomyces griseochromogenes]